MTQWQPSLILEGKDRNVSVLKYKCFEEILNVPKYLKQPCGHQNTGLELFSFQA